ncbi:hypothetical protein EDB83DRAFT_2371263 [Lactarius deliciosus]|nr:hypothetical protein EDB83DRAFT_2371263 [Lactarius deliciosus]
MVFLFCFIGFKHVLARRCDILGDITTPTQCHNIMTFTQRCDSMAPPQCHDSTTPMRRCDITTPMRRRDTTTPTRRHDIDAGAATP